MPVLPLNYVEGNMAKQLLEANQKLLDALVAGDYEAYANLVAQDLVNGTN